MAKFGQKKAKLYYMIEKKEYIIKQIQNCADYVATNFSTVITASITS